MAAADLTQARWVLDLTVADLQREVGVLAVSRAQAYAADGRVRTLVAANRGDQLLATVAGTQGLRYQTVVHRLGGEHGAPLDWASRCSCPVQVMCKHGVATILAARARLAEIEGAQGWEALLRPVVTRSRACESAQRSQPRWRLGLQVGLQAGFGGQEEATKVVLVPVREGRSRAWVRQGVSWRDLASPYATVPVVPEHRAALAPLHTMSSGSFHAGPELGLGELGPLAWAGLHSALEAGVELVPGPALTGVELGQGRAEVVIDLTRTDDRGLTVQAGARLDDGTIVHGDRVFVIGRPGHGLGRLTQEGGLTLWPLLRAPGAGVAALLQQGGPANVPPAETARFHTHYLPGLARAATVTSRDGSVPLLADVRPRVRLTLRPEPGHRLVLAWSMTYPGQEGTTELALDPQPDDPPRNRAAESALLAHVIPLLEPCPRLVGTEPGARGRPRLHPTRTLEGRGTLTFATQVLPVLEADEQVEVVVDGDLATYEEAQEAPVVTLATSEADARDWFDLHVSVTVGGQSVPFEELFAALARGEEVLLLPSGTWFELDQPELHALRRLIEEARELHDGPKTGSTVRVTRYQAGLWDELSELGVPGEQAARWQESVEALRAVGQHDLGSARVPEQLTVPLRPYQQEGFDWLATLWDHRLGGVLADDMGLGKTLQLLALVARAEERGDLAEGPVLVVAPASVVPVWESEARRFLPDLHVVTIAETTRRRRRPLAEAVGAADLVVLSYTFLRSDADEIAGLPWSALVLDEAQAVKNPRTKGHQAASRVDAPRCFVLTGTPLENSLSDLWALFALATPGLFGSHEHFRATYAAPVEDGGAPEVLERLRRRVRPFMLRRTKGEVATELPAKIEQLVRVDLATAHQRIYDRHLQRERQRVLGLLQDMDKNRIAIFRALTMLRQLALDPGLVDEDHRGAATSAKIVTLLGHLRQLRSEGHRALVFSSFTSYLALVREALEEEGIGHVYLDGRTRDRAARVAAFRDGDDPVFLISLKAGGVGLTLTEADYVFLLDPWWNPAAESQAVDRTHRIGQTRPVNVYRLVSTGTVEEKVVALQERKRELFATVVDEGRFTSGRITARDIRGLLEGG